MITSTPVAVAPVLAPFSMYEALPLALVNVIVEPPDVASVMTLN
ncbi:MAG: hypothetical protein WC701_11450 [Kiritimatiellales bacterium]